MASKRDIKKRVNYICSELFAECVATSLYGGNKDEENVKALMHTILSIHHDYVCRISHVEPGLPAKKYFSDFSKSFNGQVNEIIDQISNL